MAGIAVVLALVLIPLLLVGGVAAPTAGIIAAACVIGYLIVWRARKRRGSSAQL